jgi:hypothetical protein
MNNTIVTLDSTVIGCKHFRYREFVCNCGKCPQEAIITFPLIRKNIESLCLLLEALRYYLWYALFKEVAIIITKGGGYRCPNHPDIIQRPYSLHKDGRAADIYVPKVEYITFAQLVTNCGFFDGIGYYPQNNFVHVDVRAIKTRWVRISGQYYTIY